MDHPVTVGGKGQLARVAYRIYVLMYFSVIGFGVLGDLRGKDPTPLTITTKASAVGGLCVLAVFVGSAIAGRMAVALRPSPAEIQLALLSPLPRSQALARATGLSSTVAFVGGGAAMLVMMLGASAQFTGLTVAIQLAYMGAAAGVTLVAFGLHLLVVERRYLVPMGVVTATLVVLSARDALVGSRLSPVTVAVIDVRRGAPAAIVIALFVVGAALVWLAIAGAERIPLEKVARGAGVADRAAVAIFGNDLRTIILLQRSVGAHTWTYRPPLRVPRQFALAFPVTARGLRNLARWRLVRWLFVVATAAGVAALLRVEPVSVRTVGLSAAVLWGLGLALGEPLAQEHDRADRLALLPEPHSIEYRHLAFSWAMAFVILGAALTTALHDRVDALSIFGLTCAAASAATVAGASTYRKVWKPLVGQGSAGMFPESAGIGIAFSVAKPAVFAFVSLAAWFGSTGLVVAVPGFGVLACLVIWIRTDGFAPVKRATGWSTQ